MKTMVVRGWHGGLIYTGITLFALGAVLIAQEDNVRSYELLALDDEEAVRSEHLRSCATTLGLLERLSLIHISEPTRPY